MTPEEMKIDCCVPDHSVASPVLSDAEVERLSVRLKALANPTRLRMLDLIQSGGGEICVCEIEAFFALTQPTISHHLKILRDAGLISSRQDGTWVRHAVDPSALEPLVELLRRFETESVG